MKLLNTTFLSFLLLLFVSCDKNSQIDNSSHGKVNVEPQSAIGSKGEVWLQYNGKKTKYVTVRAKDGNVWLQQNLGALQVAQSLTDSLAFGDYFQWGRWNDGHQHFKPEPEVRNPNVLLYNNPSGLPLGGIKFYIATWWNTGTITDKWEAASAAEVDKSNGCDPCKVLGNNWRLPTNDEWNAIIEAENISDANSAYASHLKIANAGWRSSKNTFLKEINNSSRFWSSTASASNSAFSLLINENGVVKNFSDSRSFGMSIRCIQKM